MESNLNKIATHPLQTSHWAEFRRKWGNEVMETKYGILTLHKIPFTPFKVAIFEKGPEPTETMLKDLKKIGKEKNLIFIKLEPNVLVGLPDKKLRFEIYRRLTNILRNNGAIEGKRFFTPTSFWIDLKPGEEDLLKSFSSKTRYNIKIAQKHGVSVKIDNSEKAFNRYLQLTAETAGRQSFYAHSARYHKLMWNILQNVGIAHLLTATYNNKIITTWILFSWKDFLYYPYGASTDEFKNVMANNLMMWEAIKFGKKQNLKIFDLWGREEGKGFTKFKEGYNPQVVEFIGSWDLIINKPVYRLYLILDFVRWKLLKLLARLGLSKKRFN